MHLYSTFYPERLQATLQTWAYTVYKLYISVSSSNAEIQSPVGKECVKQSTVYSATI